MAISLTVSGITYLFPSNRDSPTWGSDVTDWAQAVTTALTNVAGPGDIVQTATTINNNQSSATNVTGLLFNNASVRAALVDYSVYRNTISTGATELVEVGTLYLGYKTVANTWEISQVYGCGPAGVTFTVTGTGQVQYTSTNITGSSYSGVIHYRARALTQ